MDQNYSAGTATWGRRPPPAPKPYPGVYATTNNNNSSNNPLNSSTTGSILHFTGNSPTVSSADRRDPGAGPALRISEDSDCVSIPMNNSSNSNNCSPQQQQPQQQQPQYRNQNVSHNHNNSSSIADGNNMINYNKVDAAQQQLRAESKLLWQKPVQQVVFREWYIYHYCNESNVRVLNSIQRFCYPIKSLIILYFKLWSFTGEAEFYTLFIPTLVWLGTPLDAMQVASLLCMGQYVTGTMKDAVCCPRPPCPPLELRGKRDTHDTEYGFPSTHSSHSAVFAYFLYCELVRFFPSHPVTCWAIAVFYWLNVCVSRLYLGMHWIGDLVGGWAVAFICILFHVSFVDRWAAAVLSVNTAPWWLFVLAYVCLHLVAVTHATPHDPCPCYIDSLRFAGVFYGAFYGFWIFQAQYGAITARPTPTSLADELLSWDFFKQWVVCIVLTLAAKEGSSLFVGKLLRVVFTFLSGAYAMSLPRFLRKPYLLMAKLVGLTTRGNARGAIKYYPITANSSFAGCSNPPSVPTSTSNRNHTAGTPSRHQQQQQQQSTMTPLPPSPNPPHPSENPMGANYSSRSGGGAAIEMPDGYLNAQQVWSLRTHEHWWLWDAHKRTASYAVTGFFVAYVCPVILREYFGVGKVATAAAA